MLDMYFVAMSTPRVGRTMSFTHFGHGLFCANPTELQKFSISSDFLRQLPEMTGVLFSDAVPMPEPPKQVHFRIVIIYFLCWNDQVFKLLFKCDFIPSHSKSKLGISISVLRYPDRFKTVLVLLGTWLNKGIFRRRPKAFGPRRAIRWECRQGELERGQELLRCEHGPDPVQERQLRQRDCQSQNGSHWARSAAEWVGGSNGTDVKRGQAVREHLAQPHEHVQEQKVVSTLKKGILHLKKKRNLSRSFRDLYVTVLTLSSSELDWKL